MDFVCIDRLDRVASPPKTLAMFDHDVTYSLEGHALRQGGGPEDLCFPQNVRELFPKECGAAGDGGRRATSGPLY